MRGLKINATAGTGNTINFQQGSGVTAAGLGYSTIGASSTTGFVFYIDQNTTSRAFVFDTSTITSDTARTYSMPNSNGTLALVSQLTSGTVTSVAALTIGTTGTDITSTVANSTTTPVITLNVPTASATNRGALSSADWTTFNNKQNTLTNPVTGTGTTNYIAKFTGTSTIGNSLVFDNGTNVGIGTNSPTFLLDVNGTLSASANVTGTDNVAVFHNTNTTTAGTPVIALSTASTGPDAPADIRLSGTNTKGIRIYAADSTLTSTPLGAGFQMFSVSSANFPGQMFFDSGANNNAFIAFRTAVTSGTISERMRITASGNVGIGTTAPGTSKLYVLGDATNYGITSEAPSGYGKLILKQTSGQAWSVGLSSNDLFFYYGGTSAGTRVTFANGGNVGIGTTSPNTALDVNGTINVRTNGFEFGRITTNNVTGNIGGLTFQYNSSGTFTTGMVLNGGGNVGIGTTSPLSISGYTILSLNNATNGGMIDFQTNGTTAGLMYAFSNSLNIGSSGTAPLIFLTASGNERMRITSGGALLVGGTANDFGSRQVNTSATSYTLHSVRTGTGSEGHLVFSNANGAVGSIFTNASVTSYNVTSDYRLKQDFKDYSGLDLVNKIKTYDYEWKADKSRGYGVIAHELQSVINYAVTGVKDGKEMQGVDYSKIVPVLIKAIQEQQAQIEQLKNK